MKSAQNEKANVDILLDREYRLVLEPDEDEGGFVAYYPDLPGCVTYGDTLSEAATMAEDAKREWIITAIEMRRPIPEPRALEAYSGQFKLRIPKSLHRRLAEHSREENVSMNQYCVYLLSRNDALEEKERELAAV